MSNQTHGAFSLPEPRPNHGYRAFLHCPRAIPCLRLPKTMCGASRAIAITFYKKEPRRPPAAALRPAPATSTAPMHPAPATSTAPLHPAPATSTATTARPRRRITPRSGDLDRHDRATARTHSHPPPDIARYASTPHRKARHCLPDSLFV